MDLEYDLQKNASNLAKHGVGVSLAEGDGVLDDPLGLTIEDDSAEGEGRWVTIGTNVFGSVLVVAWTLRGNRVRLISARKAEPRERKAYEETA